MRPTLERIVSMAQEEKGLERIAPDYIRLSDNAAPSVAQRRMRLSDERWAEYKQLFKRARIRDGIGLGAEAVYFYMSDIGLAGSGSSKGYLWSTRPPHPLANNLDTLPVGPDFDVFRHIEGNWYLEYSGA